MATAPFRPDVVASVNRSKDDLKRAAADMHETAIVTLEIIAATKLRMREADDVLKRG